MPSASIPICIVDDDASVLRSIEFLLESDGLAARSFESAGEFLAHAGAHDVKLAVIDVCLAGASGLEVQTRLKAISPDTKVIVMTGRDYPGLQSAAMIRGARAFLLKPFADGIFLTKVQEALRAAD
ncbi:MAG: response regulator [Verrucomicrobiota bacterium]